jgi:hypothetical protein
MKLQKYCHLVLVIILALYYQKAFAEYYRYVDESGQVSYTDNIDMIPKEQRPDIQEYYELKRIPSPDEDDDTQDGDARESEESTEQIEITPAVLKGDVNEIKADFEGRKQTIDNEYKKLLEEKKNLDNIYKKIRSAEDMEEYKKKVENLNTRIEDFKKRRDVFNAEADAFNAKLKAGTE